MARLPGLAAAIAVALFAVSGAAGEEQQTPKHGGTLTVRLAAFLELPCLNVLLTICGQQAFLGSGDWVEQVLQRSFTLGTDFTYEESLVSRVDFTKRRPFTLTYHIRPEARWSDGVPISAQDFRFTLQAIRRHGTQELRELHAPVRSARAVDRKTLRVVLRERSSNWHDFFWNILPAHALRGSDLTQVWRDRIDDPRTGRPIGSGPFLVEWLERGRQLVLRRNSRYWGAHPAYLDRLVLRFEASATDPTDRLRSGELDVAFGVPQSAWQAVRQQRGLRLAYREFTAVEQLFIQLEGSGHPALRNKLVRRALAYGIDRTALARQIWGDLDPSHSALDSAVHLTQSRYYQPNWGAYRYRPAEARRLLGQAGCRRGADGIFSCGGERLALRLVTTAGFASRALAVPLIQAQLRAAGVEVVPAFTPAPAFFGQLLPRGDFDVALYSWTNGPAASFSPLYGCGASQNHTGYCQRLVTAHLNAADRMLDADRRARVLNRADRGLAGDVPTIPLYQGLLTGAYRSSVRNFVWLPWNPWWNAENWWLAT